MIFSTRRTQIWMCRNPTDMRLGYDGLHKLNEGEKLSLIFTQQRKMSEFEERIEAFQCAHKVSLNDERISIGGEGFINLPPQRCEPRVFLGLAPASSWPLTFSSQNPPSWRASSLFLDL